MWKVLLGFTLLASGCVHGALEVPVDAGTELATAYCEATSAFVSSTSSMLEGDADHVLTGDLDRDGHLDVVLVPGHDAIRILLGDGTGAFARAGQLDVDPFSVLGGAALADLDSDGVLDLVVTDAGQGCVVTYRGDFLGSGTFAPGQRLVVDERVGYLSSSSVGDVDGDGHLDVVATFGDQLGGDDSVYVLHGSADGTLQQVAGASRIGPSTLGTSIADFDGDGLADLVSASPSRRIAAFQRGDGQLGFGEQQAVEPDVGVSALATADWNRDGIADVAFALSAPHVSGDGKAHVFFGVPGEGPASFEALKSKSSNDTFQPSTLSSADLNSDGCADLVVASPVARGVSWLRSDGAGQFDAVQLIPTQLHVRSFAAGDFDEDGRADLVVTGDGRTEILLQRP